MEPCLFSIGPLSQVGSLNATLQGSSFLLTWTPPFSLSIYGISSPITYCVAISSSDFSIAGELICDVEEPQFTAELSFSSIACNSYAFIVIPKNLAGDGERSTLILNTPGLNGKWLISFW